MTIKSDIKEKVIQMAREGKGRNQIVHEMNGMVSFGSVSNILKQWRHERLLQQKSSSIQQDTEPLQQYTSQLQSKDRVTTSLEEGLAEVEFKKHPDISIEDHVITNTQDFEENGYPVAPAKGAPLGWFMNGSKAPEEQQEQSNNSLHTSPTTNNIGSSVLSFGVGTKPTNSSSPYEGMIIGPTPPTKPESEPEIVEIDFENKPYANPYPYPEVNIKPSSNNQDVVEEDEESEEENVEQKYYQSRFPTYTSEDKRSSIKRTDNSSIDLGIDLDSAWEQGFIRYIKSDKQERQKQLQLIENGQRELEEKRQQLTQMMEIIDQRNDDLKAREAKLDEIKPLLPSVRELQENGITFDTMMSYLLAINAKAALENTDLKTAAYTMKEEFKAYRNLQDLRRVIKNSEQYLAAMGNTIRQNERAILTIIELRKLGYTEKNIRDLVAIVSAWHEGLPGISCRKLDSELINVGNNGNLQQQPGNGRLQMEIVS